MSTAYLLTGSNEGDRTGNLQKAVLNLRDLAGNISRCSPVFESPAWGFDHPTPFLNQALELKTTMSPHGLLKIILQIEEKCGRVRSGTGGYEARTLDIDILFYDDLVIDTPELTLPHPRLHLRRFALKPLSLIAGKHLHAKIGRTVAELLSECPDTGPVDLFGEYSNSCNREKEEAL